MPRKRRNAPPSITARRGRLLHQENVAQHPKRRRRGGLPHVFRENHPVLTPLEPTILEENSSRKLSSDDLPSLTVQHQTLRLQTTSAKLGGIVSSAGACGRKGDTVCCIEPRDAPPEVDCHGSKRNRQAVGASRTAGW